MRVYPKNDHQVAETPTEKRSDKHHKGISQETNLTRQNSSDVETDRNVLLQMLLSMRTITTVVIVFQVIASCFCIWVISFASGRDSLKKTSTVLLDSYAREANVFVRSMLDRNKMCVDDVVEAWNHNLITDENAQELIFSKTKVFRTSLTSLAFNYGNASTSIYFGTEKVTTQNGTVNYLVYDQKEGQKDLLLWSVNDTDTGSYDRVESVTRNYNVNNREWFQVGLNADEREGEWGNIYLTAQSVFLTIYYAKPVFSLVNNTRQKVGATKANSSLKDFSSFLEGLTLPSSGFSLITEGAGLLVASSVASEEIKEATSRISIYNIGDRGIGSLTKHIRDSMLNGANMTVTKEKIGTVRHEGNTLIVALYPFRKDNIQWTLMIVIPERAILWDMYRATFITLGLTVFIILSGIFFSVVSGYVMTRPFKLLQEEFKKIARLNFESIPKLRSPVTELSRIYRVFNAMVELLIEVKPFLPSSVLLREEPEEEETEKVVQDEPTEGSYIELHSSSSVFSLSKRLADRRPSKVDFDRKAKLDVGLQNKYVTLAYISIIPTADDDVISTCKFVLQHVSESIAVTRGDLQIIDPYQFVVSWNAVVGSKDHEEKAIRTAFGVVKTIGEYDAQFKVRIGIATGNAQCGICGTAKQRIFSVVGPVQKRVKQVQSWAKMMEVPILVDESTVDNTAVASSYIYRPIEVVQYESEGRPSLIYEILKIKDNSMDEWMYELEKSKENERYTHMIEAAQIALKILVSEQQMRDAITMLEPYLQNDNDEFMAEHLIQILNRRIITPYDHIDYKTINLCIMHQITKEKAVYHISQPL